MNGRFAKLNLLKISADSGNAAQTGSDGGVLVKRPFASALTAAVAGVSGAFSLALADFPDTNYQVSVEPAADPGEFRWWVITKTTTSVVIGYIAANAVTLAITAAG